MMIMMPKICSKDSKYNFWVRNLLGTYKKVTSDLGLNSIFFTGYHFQIKLGKGTILAPSNHNWLVTTQDFHFLLKFVLILVISFHFEAKSLTLMLLVANLANTKWCKKP